MTGRDLIGASMRLIGALASGETPSSAEATDGLTALNHLLESWSTQNLLIPNKVREVFSLVSAQSSYTMGTGGNFNTARPMAIENAGLLVGSTEYPVRVITKDEYARIILKDTQSTISTDLYPSGTYPLETLILWPVPSAANSLVLYSWKPLAQAALDTALSLPPGYERALKYGLAIELGPEYGKQPSELVVALANESKADIKRKNFRPKYLRVDDALRSQPSVFNWMTGDPS